MRIRPPSPSAPLAAIDIGSNSFRIETGQVLHGRYRRSAYLKETVRLGAGLDADHRLTEEAMQRGLACLSRFTETLRGFEPARVRAVATQTLREARNRDEFLRRAQTALGYPIEVISGREEARLIYAGVAHLQPSTTPRLVIDIGGRSTEMILGHDRTPVTAESFKVGSVSLSLRWFPDGRFTPQAFRDAQVAAGAELEEALQLFAPVYWREALGSSGTAGAVSQVLQASGITDGRITAEALRWCIEQCLAAGDVSRLQLPSLADDRKAIIGGGLSLLYTMVTHFGIQELKPAKGALRQGVIVDLHDRLAASRGAQATDMRDLTVRELQVRFDVDAEQALRVRTLASALFRSACPDADNEAMRELGWACDLHEVGLMVSHHEHHRHGAYLVANADAAGFSQSQQRRIGDLVLGQRGGLGKVESLLSQDTMAWQLLALRLAVIECHTRNEIEPRALRLNRDGRTAALRFARDWPASHPRTLHLLREESQVWARQNSLRLAVPA
jgi:exopolyphosphatase/guanosine-5'-triphosphate,3'-diphosphate pyrophosphatase